MLENIDSFLINAILAGVGISIISSPLGCFIIWRRSAYFSDCVAHSSLLGISIGLWLNLELTWALFISSISIVFLLILLQKKTSIPQDTLLGIISYTSLSLGIINISIMDNIRVDITSYLFGDLLTVNNNDIILIYITAIIIGSITYNLWNSLLSITVAENLAFIENYSVEKLKIIIYVILAITISFAMKIIGALIIGSLLLIPQSTARYFSKTPEKMVSLAFIFSITSIIGGILLSWNYDTPTGPSIIIVSTSQFLLSNLISSLTVKK